MKRKYKHWRDAQDWHWPSFTPEEVACRRTGELVIDTDALDALQRLRDAIGSPMLVTGYRSPAHNKAIGGAKNSKHLFGEAFDVSMQNHDPRKFYEAAKKAGFKAFGHYPRDNFMHLDMGPARTWTGGVETWPARTTRFAQETPVTAPLAGNGAITGSGVAGASTAATAAVTAIQQGIVDAQGMVQGAMPYLDGLKWVFIALALAGAACAIYAKVREHRRALR